jgi:GMP synthase (glutamine-hydrolysing)
MARVLVLQHTREETLGSIGTVLTHRGHEARYVRGHAGEAIPAVLEEDGLVVLGGPQSAYELDRFPFLADEVKLIASALDAGKPILGVCLGAQLLAAALGSPVYRGREKEIGWFPVQLHVDLKGDRLFGDLGRTFTPLHWHGDVFDLPKGAAELGHSARTRHQGFRYGASAYGLLFHLEVTDELVRAMVAGFGDELAAAGIDPAPLLDGLEARLAAVQPIAAGVFDAWARMLERSGA